MGTSNGHQATSGRDDLIEQLVDLRIQEQELQRQLAAIEERRKALKGAYSKPESPTVAPSPAKAKTPASRKKSLLSQGEHVLAFLRGHKGKAVHIKTMRQQPWATGSLSNTLWTLGKGKKIKNAGPGLWAEA